MGKYFDKNHPYIPVKDKKTGKVIKVQRCGFVFKDPLSDVAIAMIEKDKDLILNKVERGYFISHFLDDANWASRLGIVITNVYPPMDSEFPLELSPKDVLLH